MLGYKYNEFEIKKRLEKDTFYIIYKDDSLYSTLALTSVAVAKKILDSVYPKNKNAEMIPLIKDNEIVLKNEIVVSSCQCGCGETFINKTGQKRFIKWHNSYAYRKGIKNIWKKK